MPERPAGAAAGGGAGAAGTGAGGGGAGGTEVVGGGLRLVILGALLGSAIAWYAGRWIAALLYNQSPTDPAVFGAVTVTLIAVALVATAVPALGASRVDPNVALRTD